MNLRVTADHYWTVLLTAVVAGIFSAVVCALLLVDFARRDAEFSLDLPAFQSLRVDLAGQPDNEDLRMQIRQVDFDLRERYFQQRRFARRGAYLLAGGLAVMLVTARWAATLRRRLPMPQSDRSWEDPDMRVTRLGARAVGGLMVLLAAAAIALWLGYRDPLPRNLAELAHPTEPRAAPPGGKTAPAPAAETDLPTAAEIGRNWPRFRGPGGAGVSAYATAPTTWNGASGKGILWKSPVPLPGNSSPVVWEDRVFLTGGTMARRAVFCFDADTGSLLWQEELAGAGGRDSPPLEVSEDTGYAAPTAATDGRRVYVMFANGDLAALDFLGKVVWKLGLGSPENVYGHASSLTTYGDLLMVQFDQGSRSDRKSRLLALRGTTGAKVWQAARDVPNSWSTPIVIEHEGQAQVVTCADPWVTAYAAADGTEIWRAKCLRQDVGPSPVYADGNVFVASEFPCLSAIRAGGRGDVTETHVLWTADAGLPDTCSPLVAGPLVLLLASYGTLTCYDRLEGGEPLWEQDFDDSFCSSPSLVGNRVYLFGEEGKSWVVEPDRGQCRQIATAELGEPCVTSPALRDGRIYIRGAKHLFCIAAQ